MIYTAVEFEAKVENGAIAIPGEHQSLLAEGCEVKIVVRLMDMQAVEFQARVKDSVIEAPELYRDELDGEFIKVIVMKPNRKTAAVGLIAELMKNPVQIQGQPLKRQVIYQD